MRRRFSQKKPEPLGQILQKALKRRKVPIDLEKERILSLWGKAVGPQIAAQTRPSHIKGKTLFVGVSSSVWMHQLHFLKCDLIRQFNLFAQKEAVEKIFFSLAQIAPPPEAPAVPAASPVLKKRDRQMISECTECISDEELRGIVKRVMTKEITRRRMAESGKAR